MLHSSIFQKPRRLFAKLDRVNAQKKHLEEKRNILEEELCGKLQKLKSLRRELYKTSNHVDDAEEQVEDFIARIDKFKVNNLMNKI